MYAGEREENKVKCMMGVVVMQGMKARDQGTRGPERKKGRDLLKRKDTRTGCMPQTSEGMKRARNIRD